MPTFAGGKVERWVHDEKTGESKKVEEILPVGDVGLMRYLGYTVKYPVVAQELGVQGRVIVSFIVDVDGSITDVKVLKSADPSLDKEAVRAIKAMPKWNPGMQDGKPVRVQYSVPVTFRM